MFLIAVFVFISNKNHTKYLSVAEWLNKLCCNSKMEYYTSMKKNELELHTLTQMYLTDRCSKEEDTK